MEQSGIDKEMFKEKNRKIREQVFRLVFMRDFHENEELDEQFDLFKRRVSKSVEPEVLDAALKKASDIVEKIGDLDGVLSASAKGWSLSRMGKAEITVMRIAIYEMLIEKTNEKIAINEAVELIKEYGGDASASFVNGVLANVNVYLNKEK